MRSLPGFHRPLRVTVLFAGWASEQKAIVRADLDLAEIAEGKYDLDVVGHYARPDIFQLSVNERPMPTVVIEHDDSSRPADKPGESATEYPTAR